MAPLNQHQLNKIYAFRALEELISIGSPQAQFYFLRGVDPFVFEEMILTALKRQGHGIIRNDAYTGDGGADGCVFMDGVRYLIQAKRYKKHIKAADIESFTIMCKRRKAKGLFVHTGKTGKRSRAHAYCHDIKVMSGSILLDLLCTPQPEKTIILRIIANDVFQQQWLSLGRQFNRCAWGDLRLRVMPLRCFFWLADCL